MLARSGTDDVIDMIERTDNIDLPRAVAHAVVCRIGIRISCGSKASLNLSGRLRRIEPLRQCRRHPAALPCLTAFQKIDNLRPANTRRARCRRQHTLPRIAHRIGKRKHALPCRISIGNRARKSLRCLAALRDRAGNLRLRKTFRVHTRANVRQDRRYSLRQQTRRARGGKTNAAADSAARQRVIKSLANRIAFTSSSDRAHCGAISGRSERARHQASIGCKTARER